MANPSLVNHPNVDDWIAIDAEGRIHVRTGKVDIGQRISTAIAILAAEELGADPADIIVEPRQTGITPNEGVTAGSNSVVQSGDAVRRAASTVRRHLLQLAGEHLDCDPVTLRLDEGVIGDTRTNRSVSLKDLVGGRKFAIAVDPDAELRAPESYTCIGKAARAPGTPGQVTGARKFVHDMTVEGMWHARVVRPPHSKAALIDLDDDLCARLKARGMAVVRDGGFVAVAGPEEYAVINAAERLTATAQCDRGTGLDDSDIFSALTGNETRSFEVIDGTPKEGPVPTASPPPAEAATTLATRYERPYQMHGSIGPSAALAHMVDGGMTLWTHSQGIYPLRGAIAEMLEMEESAITVHHALGSGCYGHNGADDAAYEAVLVARALPGRPILLKWTRDDEHAWEPYASAMVVKVRASLDAAGRVIDFAAESYSDTHSCRPSKAPGEQARLVANRYRDPTLPPFVPAPNMTSHGGLHRNLDPYYTFARRRLVKHLVSGLPLRTSAMRCLGAVANVFAQESFMDELAAAAGRDPVAFRLDHLEDPRAHEVLETAARGIGWGDPDLETGEGIGIAFSRYKNSQTYAAVAVRLAVDDAAQVRLISAFIAADAGEVVDPDGLEAQMEGGFIQAASWSLVEQVTYDRDGITSRDWDSYPILKFTDVPEVRVRLIDRPGTTALGAGEATSGPSVAAIANAICRATGLRLRRMPFTPDAIRAAAMAAPD